MNEIKECSEAVALKHNLRVQAKNSSSINIHCAVVEAARP